MRYIKTSMIFLLSLIFIYSTFNISHVGNLPCCHELSLPDMQSDNFTSMPQSYKNVSHNMVSKTNLNSYCIFHNGYLQPGLAPGSGISGKTAGSKSREKQPFFGFSNRNLNTASDLYTYYFHNPPNNHKNQLPLKIRLLC